MTGYGDGTVAAGKLGEVRYLVGIPGELGHRFWGNVLAKLRPELSKKQYCQTVKTSIPQMYWGGSRVPSEGVDWDRRTGY